MDIQHVIAWGLFLCFVVGMLAVDLLFLHRKPRELAFREALAGSILPVILAMAFVGCIYGAYAAHAFHLGELPAGVNVNAAHFYPTTGKDAAVFFVTGYVVELSLSADNVFLFVILMTFFQVPKALQHRVLFWGVLGALVMRGAMILLGTELLASFEWLIYVFGAFLLVTGVRMLLPRKKETDPSDNFAVRMVKRLVRVEPGFHGKKFFTRVNGRLVATTLFLVLVCIEFTDLVFALDSIPAIFGITRDPFIVFTSNVFAILGLRSMYFLLAGVMDKFRYLKVGLALVLAFVGLKMVLPLVGAGYGRWVSGRAEHWDVDQYVSLAIILGTLGVSVLVSVLGKGKSLGAVPEVGMSEPVNH